MILIMIATVALLAIWPANAVGQEGAAAPPWDETIAQEEGIWRRLLVNFGRPSRLWPEAKESLQSVLDEYPESQWADDAVLCLAGGVASFEGDTDSAIDMLRDFVAKEPQGDTPVEHWARDMGCEFDPYWLTWIRAVPFDRDDLVEFQELEVRARFEHLSEHPIRTSDVARWITAQLLADKGDTSAAVSELEALLRDSPDIEELARLDRQAAEGEYGYPLGHDDGRIYRPQYWAHKTLMRLYADQGEPDRAASVALEWMNALSPDGMYWQNNKNVGNLLSEIGHWTEAAQQYAIAKAGLERYIDDGVERCALFYRLEFGTEPSESQWPVWRASVTSPWQGMLEILDAKVQEAEANRPLETSVAQVDGEATRGPQAFTLEPNWPNPFNAATRLRHAVPADGRVVLAIYNELGQRVATLVDGGQEAGSYVTAWGGTDAEGQPVASGLYLAVLEAGGGVVARRMMLLR
ncbi:FlgD immunoglobulin-like domain containing protein [Candidatus Latescibacterota bacterium]